MMIVLILKCVEGIDVLELGQNCEDKLDIILDCGVLSKEHLRYLNWLP